MKKLFGAIAFFILMLSAFAHEYILIANKYRIAKGDTLEVHLFVADGFNIELERPMQTAITKKFEMITENGTIDLLATTDNGSLPVINRRADFEGLGLIHTERGYARITLPTAKFLSYLKEDHIENIKVKNDSSKKFRRERYTRYIKCLV